MRDANAIVAKAVEGEKLQLTAEAYYVLKSAIRVSHDEMRTVFSEWNRGELADPFVAAAADVLGLRDEDGDPLLEKVLDGSRGPELCRDAVTLALEMRVPAPLASQAACSSFLAGRKDERVDASSVLSGPKTAFSGDRHAMIEELRKALIAAFILAYAEAYSLLTAAGSDQAGSSSALGSSASPIAAASAEARARIGPKENILLDAKIKSLLDPSLASLRRVCSRSADGGLHLPIFSAALSYYDGIRSTWLPSNMVVALRDSFEGTGYERIDRPRGEAFHSEWR